MKNNIKNIVIPLETCSIKPKQIINTTIINSPKIISSKNHLIIKQFINTTESDKKGKKKFLYHRNIIVENKDNILKKQIFTENIPLIYHKQALNYNSSQNENSTSIMNNTMTMFKKNKNFINKRINKNNKTNNNINKTVKISEMQNNNNKNNIESYHCIYPNKNKISFGNKKINIKLENNFSNIRMFDNNIEDLSLDKKEKNNNKNRNSNILIYEIDKEKSKTFEKLNNKRYKKKMYNYKKKNKRLNYKNETNINKTLKSTQSEISLYIKKYPFQ